MCNRSGLRRTLLAAGVMALFLVGCSSSGSGSSPSATTTAKRQTVTTITNSTAPPKRPPPTTGSTLATGPSGPSGLHFRPVIGSQPCSSVTAGAPAGVSPGTATTLPVATVPVSGRPELVPAEDGGLCYHLGAVAATGADLARAVASADAQTGGWTVLVTAKGEGKAKLNALFDACAGGTSTCPAGEGGAGSVAVELDGKVISAPAIQAKGLASSPFQISGAFTQQRAQALAARLND
jgi:hypothetical protein